MGRGRKLLLAGCVLTAAIAGLRVGLGGAAPGVEQRIAPAETASDPQRAAEIARGRRRVALPGAQPLGEPPTGPLLRGRVVIPPGTPDDERLALVLLTNSRERGRWDLRRVELPIEGRAVVPFVLSAEDALTWELEARHLERLAGRIEEQPPGEELVLEPQLGGIVRGGVTELEACRYRALLFRAGALAPLADAPVDEDGRFELLRAAPGSGLELELQERHTPDELRRARGWRSVRGTLSARATLRRGLRRGLAVEAGRTTELELALEPGALVAGRVLDSGGAPLPGALVELHVAQMDAGRPHDCTIDARVDAEGRFRCAGLPAGAVRIVASLEGRVRSELALPPLAPGEAREELALTLDLGAQLSGRVLLPDGRPAARARVELAWPEGSEGERRSLATFAELDGSFVFHALPDVLCTLSALLGTPPGADDLARGGRLTALAREVRPGPAELTLHLEPGERVRGRALDAGGAPLRSFTLRAEPVGERGDEPARASLERDFYSPDGWFELSGLGAGRWELSARAFRHAPSPPLELTLPSAQPVELRCPREE